MGEAVVRLQALDGGWETVGVERLTGIKPEKVELSANKWGSDTCRFLLRRDPRAVHPDLGAFTPCEVAVAGVPVWSGRVWETPTQEGPDTVMSVEGRGWQYHLDDDQFTRLFIHNRLSDWVDSRTIPGANLTTGLPAAFNVNAGQGQIYMGLPLGATVSNGRAARVQLDVGEGNTAKMIVLSYTTGGLAGMRLYVGVSDDAQGSATDWTLFNGTPMSNQNRASVTFTTARRYVHILWENDVGGNLGGAETGWVQLSEVLVVAAAAYLTGANGTWASNVPVSTIVADAIQFAPLLSQDTSLISATAFKVPFAAWPMDGKTPREVIDAHNALHSYRTRVEVDTRMRFDALPSVAKFEAGDWQGCDFQDASANSGESMFNACCAEGIGPDGRPIRVKRYSANDVTTTVIGDGTVAVSNPGFEVDASSWTNLTRSTAVHFAGVGSGNSSTPNTAIGTVTGTFKKGVTYVLEFYLCPGSNSDAVFTAKFGLLGIDEAVLSYTTQGNLGTYIGTDGLQWEKLRIVWQPKADRTGVQIALLPTQYVANPGVGWQYWVDAFTINRSRATLIDKRGFTRTVTLPVSGSFDRNTLNQLCDVYLLNHRSTPLRGNATILDRGLRIRGQDETAHPAHLLINTQELIRFTNRIDPDTGANGRDGRIVSVTYTDDDERASIAIDNERQNFEAMVSRLAAIQGSG